MGRWATVDLPIRGVYRPQGDIKNPLESQGFFHSLEGWKIQEGVLRLTEGEEKYDKQTHTASSSIRWIADYSNSFYYITGKELRKITSTKESKLFDAFLSTSSTSRLSSVFFRGRFLIADQKDGLRWLDPSQDTYRTVGVPAPQSAPSLAEGVAGALTGTYKYVVTFVDDQGFEGNPSPFSSISVTEKKISLTGIPVGGTGISKRRIYRTISEGEDFLYLTELSDNSTTTYTDNAEDFTLGNPVQYDNDTPPSAIRQIFNTAQRVYLVDDDGRTLWASKIDPFTATPAWESFPPHLSHKLPFDTTKNPAQAGFELGSFVYVASQESIYRILGDPGTGIVVKKALEEGFFGRFSFVLFSDKVAFVNQEKKLMLWDGDSAPIDIGKGVQTFLNQMEGDETALIYDEKAEVIRVYFKTEKKRGCVRVHLGTGIAWDAPSSTHIPLYVGGLTYSTVPGSTTILVEEGYRLEGSRRTVQAAEWHSFTPFPGKDVYMGRLKIELEGLPIVSYIPPMLRIGVAFNDSSSFVTRDVDLTGKGKKVVYVPLYRRAESITVRLSTLNNAASLDNDVKIYKVGLEIEEEQSRGKQNGF